MVEPSGCCLNAHFVALCFKCLSFSKEIPGLFSYKLYSLSGFNIYCTEYEKLTLKESKIEQSKQHKNTPNSKLGSLAQIAILHTDLSTRKA